MPGPSEFPAVSLGDSSPGETRSAAGATTSPPPTTSITPPPEVASTPAPPAAAESPQTDGDTAPRTLVTPNFGGVINEDRDEDAFPRPELNTPEPRVASAPPEKTSPESPADTANLDRLSLDVIGPDRRQAGAGATFRVTIRNEGTDPVDHAVVSCEFDPALTFGDSPDREVRQRLGRIAAGESKELSLTLVAETPGRHCARFALKPDSAATVSGPSGVPSPDSPRHRATACVEYVARSLSLSITGPARRTTGSRAEFGFRVANLTETPIPGVVLEVTRDAALVLRELTAGSQRTAGRIRWEIGPLGPREEVVYQAEFECRAPRERATIGCSLAAEGLSAEEYETTLEVVPVTGSLDVRLADLDDPVPNRGSVRYEARIQNLGLQPVRDVVVQAVGDARVTLESAEVWISERKLDIPSTRVEGEIRLAPIPELAADATLRVVLTGKATETGDAEATIRVSHETPESTVTVTETTHIAAGSAPAR